MTFYSCWSLDAIDKIESTEDGTYSILELTPFEAPTEEEKDVEEKVVDMILKENVTNESKSAVNNFEIEQVVDPFVDVDVKADPDEEVIGTPGEKETKPVEDTTQPTATSAELEGFETRCENLSKGADEHVKPEENDSEAAVYKSNDATFKTVPFPFDPGINFKVPSKDAM